MMAGHDLAKKIATLGCFCGITAAYWDNFGERHHTSQAAYRALLTAMGIDCEDPERLTQELARRRLGPWSALLGPVLAVSGSGQIPVRPWAPSPEMGGVYEAQVELVNEHGQRLTWETPLKAGPNARLRPVGEGFRSAMELALPRDLAPGYYDLTMEVRRGRCREADRTRLIVAPEQTWAPDWLAAGRRVWGFNLPLYALKSKKNWGIGDFGDLAEVARWAAGLGAGFVGVNPLHAPSGHDRPSPSPYSPTSRVFLNILYLDLEMVPELASCHAAQELLASQEFHQARERLRQARMLDYEEIYRLKRQVLGMLYQTFVELHGPPEVSRTPRGQDFARFLADKGPMLEHFGQFCALADYFGEDDWRRWPPDYHHPGTPAVAAFSREQVRALRLYQYGQWLAAGQLNEVCRQAAQQGLAFTLYADLALGASAGGFDTWALPHLFAREAAIGAPPDGFNPQGQNWGLPPLIPLSLRESGYQLFIDTLRANSPPGGMLRIDHVMSLFRLLWVPPGMAPADGAYVAYPARELLAILALESLKRRTLIVGEDLGTVPPHVRRHLAKAAVLSYKVFYFERGGEGQFLPPEDYPSLAVAAVTTHDLPTLAGYWEGRDLALRCENKFHCQPEQVEADLVARDRDRRLLVETLHNRGLLSDEVNTSTSGPCPPPVRLGVLEYLAQSPAALMEVRLEEVFGLTEQQNLPGTTDEHPNWRLRLPLTLEEMAQSPEPARVAARLNRHRGTN
jgi:4-alpha-glucanotransferase